MAIIFEGTFADLQAQLYSLPLRPDGHVRVESQDALSSIAIAAEERSEAAVYLKKIEDIIAEQDEDEVRNACRIAEYQYPDRAA